MQKNNLTYEWNDVALLVDQRAYTLVCKTMLQIAEQNMNEIQDITLYDWVWNSEELEDKTIDCTLVPFQGTVTLQIQYLNHDKIILHYSNIHNLSLESLLETDDKCVRHSFLQILYLKMRRNF